MRKSAANRVVPLAMGLPTSPSQALNQTATEQEAWVRKVNGRWLVRADLQQHASTYLDHLAENDPSRLAKTCRIVLRMMEIASDSEDPKPRFYGALFSLTTPDERKRFLASHQFTRLTLPNTQLPPPLLEISALTQDKLLALRNDLQICIKE